MLRLPRRRGETIPTWLERIVRRREWKSPPRLRRTARSPNQLATMISPSVAADSQGELQPVLRAAGVDDDVALERRVVGVRVRDAEALAHRRLRAVDVDDDDVDARDAAQQPRDGAADHARPDDA